jgi:hypothetical protein
VPSRVPADPFQTRLPFVTAQVPVEYQMRLQKGPSSSLKKPTFNLFSTKRAKKSAGTDIDTSAGWNAGHRRPYRDKEERFESAVYRNGPTRSISLTKGTGDGGPRSPKGPNKLGFFSTSKDDRYPPLTSSSSYSRPTGAGGLLTPSHSSSSIGSNANNTSTLKPSRSSLSVNSSSAGTSSTTRPSGTGVRTKSRKEAERIQPALNDGFEERQVVDFEMRRASASGSSREGSPSVRGHERMASKDDMWIGEWKFSSPTARSL